MSAPIGPSLTISYAQIRIFNQAFILYALDVCTGRRGRFCNTCLMRAASDDFSDSRFACKTKDSCSFLAVAPCSIAKYVTSAADCSLSNCNPMNCNHKPTLGHQLVVTTTVMPTIDTLPNPPALVEVRRGRTTPDISIGDATFQKWQSLFANRRESNLTPMTKMWGKRSCGGTYHARPIHN